MTEQLPVTRPADPVRAADRARVVVFVVFALAGVMFASFASRLPHIKEVLDLSAGQLGLLLLCGSMGSLIGLPLAGSIAQRLGTARAVAAGTVIAVTGFSSVAAAVDVFHSPVLFGVSLFVATFGMGLWDVSMNLEGATVERAIARAIMPHFHAAFSGGTVLAALVGAGATAGRLPLVVHLFVVAALVLATVLWSVGRFLPDDHPATDVHDADEPRPSARRAWTDPRTLLIGVVVFVAALTEGTANDWLAVAMVEGHRLPQWAGVLAFAVFLAAMTGGRLVGTRLLDRHGRVPVLRVLGVVALVGSLLVVFGGPVLAFVGAALWGVGASLGFPVGMSAAADDPRHAATRVSVVSTVGYGAFLAGPPALGFLGDHVGILRALLVVGVAVLAVLVVLPAVREPHTADAGRPSDVC